MGVIGGNITAIIQIKTSTGTNEIGEAVPIWENIAEIKGFLDLTTGDSRYNVYDAKIQESSHIFMCDYKDIVILGNDWLWDQLDFLNAVINENYDKTIRLDSEHARMLINNKQYDIMVVDDPMQLHQHLEIYLKYTGGQVCQ